MYLLWPSRQRFGTIGYMDIDMSTDMSAISKMIQIFKEDRADIVNASRYNLTRINRKSFFAFPPNFKYNKEKYWRMCSCYLRINMLTK